MQCQWISPECWKWDAVVTGKLANLLVFCDDVFRSVGIYLLVFCVLCSLCLSTHFLNNLE